MGSTSTFYSRAQGRSCEVMLETMYSTAHSGWTPICKDTCVNASTTRSITVQPTCISGDHIDLMDISTIFRRSDQFNRFFPRGAKYHKLTLLPNFSFYYFVSMSPIHIKYRPARKPFHLSTFPRKIQLDLTTCRINRLLPTA